MIKRLVIAYFIHAIYYPGEGRREKVRNQAS